MGLLMNFWNWFIGADKRASRSKKGKSARAIADGPEKSREELIAEALEVRRQGQDILKDIPEEAVEKFVDSMIDRSKL